MSGLSKIWNCFAYYSKIKSSYVDDDEGTSFTVTHSLDNCQISATMTFLAIIALRITKKEPEMKYDYLKGITEITTCEIYKLHNRISLKLL